MPAISRQGTAAWSSRNGFDRCFVASPIITSWQATAEWERRSARKSPSVMPWMKPTIRLQAFRMTSTVIRSTGDIQGMGRITIQLRSRSVAGTQKLGPTIEMRAPAEDYRQFVLHSDLVEQRPPRIRAHGNQQFQTSAGKCPLPFRQVEQRQVRHVPPVSERGQLRFDVPVPVECEITHNASPLHVRTI